MNTKQKLQAFEAYTISHANTLYKQNLEKLSKEIQLETNLQTNNIKESLEKKLEQKYQNMIKNKNQKIAKKHNSLLQNIATIKLHHDEKVKILVQDELRQFTRSASYLPLLEDNLTTIADTATKIILSKDDHIHIAYLHSKFNTNIFATGNFIGGYIAYFQPNILIDNSFDTILTLVSD